MSNYGCQGSYPVSGEGYSIEASSDPPPFFVHLLLYVVFIFMGLGVLFIVVVAWVFVGAAIKDGYVWQGTVGGVTLLFGTILVLKKW